MGVSEWERERETRRLAMEAVGRQARLHKAISDATFHHLEHLVTRLKHFVTRLNRCAAVMLPATSAAWIPQRRKFLNLIRRQPPAQRAGIVRSLLRILGSGNRDNTIADEPVERHLYRIIPFNIYHCTSAIRTVVCGR